MNRLILLLPLLACAVLCLGALPPRLEIRETHDGRPFTLSLTPRRAESGCEVYAFSFPSPVRSGSAANDVVSGELFRPLRPVRGRQHPAALVFHIIGPGDFWWTFFARVWTKLVPLRPLIARAYARFIR